MRFLSCSPACVRASRCSAQHRAGRRKKNVSLRLPSLSCYVLRCPTARAHAGAFRLERSCSLGVEVKRAVPLPSERNAKHEHNRNPHLHRMPRNRSTTHEQLGQAVQIPGSTTGMENCFTSRMSDTRHHATVRNTRSGSRLLENAHSQSSLLRLRTRMFGGVHPQHASAY